MRQLVTVSGTEVSSVPARAQSLSKSWGLMLIHCAIAGVMVDNTVKREMKGVVNILKGIRNYRVLVRNYNFGEKNKYV